MIDLSTITEFEWDGGNSEKNEKKHAVTRNECQEVFFNEPRRLFFDESHSQSEERYMILGCTDESRKLTVIFTVRDQKIRVVSARDQSKKDRAIYIHDLLIREGSTSNL